MKYHYTQTILHNINLQNTAIGVIFHSDQLVTDTRPGPPVPNPPRDASSLQHVGDAHVPGPDVKLPLLQAQHPAQHRARVDPDPHVHVVVELLPHEPEREN